MWLTSLPPYLGDVLFEWPLRQIFGNWMKKSAGEISVQKILVKYLAEKFQIPQELHLLDVFVIMFSLRLFQVKSRKHPV